MGSFISVIEYNLNTRPISTAMHPLKRLGDFVGSIDPVGFRGFFYFYNHYNWIINGGKIPFLVATTLTPTMAELRP